MLRSGAFLLSIIQAQAANVIINLKFEIFNQLLFIQFEMFKNLKLEHLDFE